MLFVFAAYTDDASSLIPIPHAIGATYPTSKVWRISRSTSAGNGSENLEGINTYNRHRNFCLMHFFLCSVSARP